MRVRFLALLVTLIALAGGLRAEVCRLFLIGDSIMVQYTPALKLRLPVDWIVDGKKDTAGAPPAANNLDVPTGANGGDSGMVLRYLRMRQAHDPVQADLLVLNCGLHDLKCDLKTGARQVPLGVYRENLRGIIALAREMHLRVAWVRTTPVVDAVHNPRQPAFSRHAADVEAYNAAADEIMLASGIPEIDLHGFTAHFIPAAYVDHVHYTAAMQENQAAYLAGALQIIWQQVSAAPPAARPARSQ